MNIAERKADWSDTILLILSHSKTEKYLYEIHENLNIFWPEKPQSVTVTDGDLHGEGIFNIKDRTFTELLHAALQRVQADFTNKSYIFLLLEDLCPFGDVDNKALLSIKEEMQNRGISYASFPWHYAELNRLLDQNQEKWIVKDNLELALLAPGGNFHIGVIASIWDMNHLIWVVENKISKGILDPWGFERAVDGNTQPHYMVRGLWPVVADGFLHRGKINRVLFTYQDWPPSPLLSRLRKEVCGIDSAKFVRLYLKIRDILALPQRALRAGWRRIGRRFV